MYGKETIDSNNNPTVVIDKIRTNMNIQNVKVDMISDDSKDIGEYCHSNNNIIIFFESAVKCNVKNHIRVF